MARILVLTNMYPPHHYGGLELSCADVVSGLRQRSHEVEVLTSTVRISGVVGEEWDIGRRPRRELQLYWDEHELLSPPLRHRLAVERSNQRSLRRALAEFRPDVVSVWGMGAVSLGLLHSVSAARIPLVFCVCDDWLEYGPRLDAWSRLFVGRPRLGRLVTTLTGLPTRMLDIGSAGTFCWVSDRTRRFAEEHTAWRFPQSTTVYSGVDLETFDVEGDGEPRSWQWKLLYVGRIDPRKGVETAVRALRRLPDAATLTVVGRGDRDELARLRAVATELGLLDRITFTSSDRSDLPAIYAGADAVLFTSVWDEPFGLVPLEAMASKTPVIATGRGGSGEFLIDETNCLLFPADDNEALARTVARLANEPDLRCRMIEAGTRTARELSITRLVDTLEAWHVAASNDFADGVPPDRPAPTLTQEF